VTPCARLSPNSCNRDLREQITECYGWLPEAAEAFWTSSLERGTPPASRPVGKLVAGPRRPKAISPEPWLEHLRKHLPVARLGADPEGVHQIRVACARLLVWLELGRWRVLRDDLRWLRGHAARVRDLDVLRAEDPSAFLEGERQAALRAAREELVRALDGPRVGSLMCGLQSMPNVPPRSARAVTSRLARSCLRRGRRLGARGAPVQKLHRLRCAVRRLRFALEWRGIEAPKAVELQRVIGVVCDHATALRQMERGPEGVGAGDRKARAQIARALRLSLPVALDLWRKSRPYLKRLT
jgi:hypothetical protein